MKFHAIVALLCWAGVAPAQTVRVTGTVSFVRQESGKPASDPANTVVWLKQVGDSPDGRNANRERAQQQLVIRQIHKRFEPHILPVELGSVVWFPNLDPFFHNVFSMYEGNRFDLGLYEAGASHKVKFDRPGICFIFCNIHPEMSAVVVVVEGPHYGLSNRAGEVSIANVPPGRYKVYSWHERARSAAPQPAEVTISSATRTLPVISLVESVDLITPHKNKYGRDYPTGVGGYRK